MRGLSAFSVDRSARRPACAAAALAATLAAGCASDARTVYDGPTLRPGETVTCVSSPCDLYFEIPAGSGSHRVLQGTIPAGEGSGGERVYLGSYYTGQQVFTLEGSDLPPAYLTVMGKE